MSKYNCVYIQIYECIFYLCLRYNLRVIILNFYLIFLPSLLIYFVFQHRIYVILYNLCFFYFYNHFVSVKVYFYSFHNIFLLNWYFIFIILVSFYPSFDVTVFAFWIFFVKTVDMFLNITLSSNFTLHSFTMFLIEVFLFQ